MKRMPYEPFERGLKELSREEVEPFHYERTMAKARAEIERRNPIMFAVKRTALVTGVVAVLFIALLLIPATYSMRVGSLVKAEFAIDDDALLQPVNEAVEGFTDELEAIMDVVSGIDGITNRNLSIDNGRAELSLAFRDRPAGEVEREVYEALSRRLGDDSELSVSSEDIEKLMGGNALAAVTGGRIRIGVEDMTDEEIEAVVANALESSGVQVKSIEVNTDRSQEGQIRRMVRVEGELPEGADPDDIDVLQLKESLGLGDGEKEVIVIRKNCDE